jgi:hypothetical protein
MNPMTDWSRALADSVVLRWPILSCSPMLSSCDGRLPVLSCCAGVLASLCSLAAALVAMRASKLAPAPTSSKLSALEKPAVASLPSLVASPIAMPEQLPRVQIESQLLLI